MSSKHVMRGMIAFYIFLFFLYLFGPLLVACRLDPSGTGLHIQGTFQGQMANWRVGDQFSVRVGLPGAALLLNLNKTILRFEETQPAGADCPLCRRPTVT